MTSKKKGFLTTSGEWAKHLRPRMKRLFWHGERYEELNEMELEKQNIYIPTVEELLSEVASWNPGSTEQELYVAPSLKHENVGVSTDLAMSIVLDKILSLEYFPNGRTDEEHGFIYHYKKENSE